jgi:hypothetical protein
MMIVMMETQPQLIIVTWALALAVMFIRLFAATRCLTLLLRLVMMEQVMESPAARLMVVRARIAVLIAVSDYGCREKDAATARLMAERRVMTATALMAFLAARLMMTGARIAVLIAVSDYGCREAIAATALLMCPLRSASLMIIASLQGPLEDTVILLIAHGLTAHLRMLLQAAALITLIMIVTEQLMAVIVTALKALGLSEASTGAVAKEAIMMGMVLLI